MYLLKLSLLPWKKAPFNQFFTALAVGFLLLTCGLLYWMERGLRPLLLRMKTEQVITAYLDPSLEKNQEEKLVDSVQLLLGSHSIDVKLVGREGFLSHLREYSVDLEQELGKLGIEKMSLIPRYLTISGTPPEGALNQIRALSGIESAESSTNRYSHLIDVFHTLGWIIRLLIGGLCLALFILLIQLSHLNANEHREAFSLLRLFGGGFFQARLPAMLSGFWCGFLGGMFALLAWFFGRRHLATEIQNHSFWLTQIPAPPLEIGFTLLLGGLVFGLFTGTFAHSTLRTSK